MYKVVLVEDQQLFRESLRKIIQDWDDFEVIGEAGNGQDGLELCHKLLPDLVLMDIHMPQMNGVEATWHIRKELPSVRVVMLTVSDEDADLFVAIKNGAHGYILKDTPLDRLHAHLSSAMSGEPPLSGAIAYKVMEEFRQLIKTPNNPWEELMEKSLEPLTDRETEIIKLIAEGLSNLEIAERLVISEQTVKKHLHNILEKLQLNNRVQAAVYAVKTGLTS